MKEIYVLTVNESYDYERVSSVMVFECYEDAYKEMKGLMPLKEKEGWVMSSDAFTFCYHEDGDYTRNHLEVAIEKREIIPMGGIPEEKEECILESSITFDQFESNELFNCKCYDGYAECISNKHSIIVTYPHRTVVINNVDTARDVLRYRGLHTLRPKDITYGDIMLYFGKVEKVQKIKYKWTASSDDGAFEDKSKISFDTQRECYNDMRDAALEKMKWNTEYHSDLDDGEVAYSVTFDKDTIEHHSYSGLYTYKIEKEVMPL